MDRAGTSLRLLYTDADADSQRAVQRAFEGWTVTTADSGEAAVAEFEATDGGFHCVVSAGELPDTDPLSFYRSVSEIDDSVPFVIFTEPISANCVRDAYRQGVADVVFKQPDASASGAQPATSEPTGVGGDNPESVGVASDDPESVGVGGDDPESVGVGGDDPQSVDFAGDESAATLETQPPQAADSEPIDGTAGLRHSVGELLVHRGSELQGTTFNVSRSLMSAADDEIDVKIEWALQSLATELGASQCLLYLLDEEETQLTKTYGWQDDEIATPTEDSVQSAIGNERISTGSFPGFESQLQQFESACYDASTADSSAEHPQFDNEQGTLLALPIIIEWQLTGTIVITTPIPRRWEESVREQLTSVGELIVHTTRRRDRRAELEQQNERLEQFASVISHDLQNPLSVVSGYLELAMDTGDTDRLQPAVEATERMETMLNEMLTLAREGRAVGETEPVELAAIVDDAWIGVDAPQATLTTEELETLPTVEADRTRLTEAFENLFRNAVDHVGNDVSITVSATADGNGIAVADNGQGIPAEKRQEVFEQGYTGGNGTGLGLAIIERIIEGHGWSIRITESESGGAKFVIEFAE